MNNYVASQPWPSTDNERWTQYQNDAQVNTYTMPSQSHGSRDHVYWSSLEQTYYQPQVVVRSSIPVQTVQDTFWNPPTSPTISLAPQYANFGDNFHTQSYSMDAINHTLDETHFNSSPSHPTQPSPPAFAGVPSHSQSNQPSSNINEALLESSSHQHPSQTNRYQAEACTESEHREMSSQQWNRRTSEATQISGSEQSMLYSSYPHDNRIGSHNESAGINSLVESQSSHQEHYNWIQASPTDSLSTSSHSQHSQHNFRTPFHSDQSRISPAITRGSIYMGSVDSVPNCDSDADSNNYRQRLDSAIYPHPVGFDSSASISMIGRNGAFTTAMGEEDEEINPMDPSRARFTGATLAVGSLLPNEVQSRFNIPEQRENNSSSTNGNIGYNTGHSSGSFEISHEISGHQNGDDQHRSEMMQQHHKLEMGLQGLRSSSSELWVSPSSIPNVYRFENNQEQETAGRDPGSLSGDSSDCHLQTQPRPRPRPRPSSFYPNLENLSKYRANSEVQIRKSDVGVDETHMSSISTGFATRVPYKLSLNHRLGPPSVDSSSTPIVSLNDEYPITSEGFKLYNTPSNPTISPALTQHPQVFAMPTEPYQISPIIASPEPIDEEIPSVPSQKKDSRSQWDDETILGSPSSKQKKKKKNDVKDEESGQKDEPSVSSSSSSKRHHRNGSNSNTEEGNSATPVRPTRKRDKSIATHIACTFCRRRKIACIAGPSQDRDVGPCMPCAKRDLTCSRPPTNRRGQRKKDSDVVDEQGSAQSQRQSFDKSTQYTRGVADLSINDQDPIQADRGSSASSSDEASPVSPLTSYKRSSS